MGGCLFRPVGGPLSPEVRCAAHTPSRTGFQSKELIIHAGLALGDIDIHSVLDVTIDGADE